MGKTLSEIAAFLQATVVGDGAVEICDIKDWMSGRGGLTFLANPKYRRRSPRRPLAILVSAPVEGREKTSSS